MKITTNLVVATGLILAGTFSFAQEVTGYERVYYSNPDDIEESNIIYSIKNPVAQTDHCKLSMKIENNSNDVLLFIPNESAFHYPFGDKQPDFKTVTLTPGDKKTKTVIVKGTENFLQKTFTYEIGGLYQIPIDGTSTETVPFQLPASQNSFTTGNFKVQLKKYNASTKEAEATFEVTYIGDGVGLINPTSLSVTAKRNKSDETVTYANDDKKSEMEILYKNDKVDFKAVFHIPGKIVDMQFATMSINWNKTFIETDTIPMEPILIEFTMDSSLTEDKK